MNTDHISIRRHGKLEVHSYDVNRDQLDRIERAGGDVGFNFHLAELFLTIFVTSLLGAFLSLPPEGIKRTISVAVIIVSFFLWPIFGFMWYRDRGAFSRIINEIRSYPEIGPIGDEKRELGIGELRSLTLGPTGPTGPAEPVGQPSQIPQPELGSGPAGYVNSPDQPTSEQK
jgi:hypothetical protein